MSVRRSFQVGRLAVGPVEQDIRAMAWEAGVTIRTERHMGWLDGVLLIELAGPKAREVADEIDRMTWR